MEEPLLPCSTNDVEHPRKHGFLHNIWHLLTFKSIDPVLECGVKRQLDSTDLLQLPDDLDPSPCHILMQQSWEAQQKSGSAQPSLFKAIGSVYGWPYLRLGLLKVINDCMGFVGPLLLNKLIRFLQQGSDHYEGYLFAVLLGLAYILKSFLDTQYSYHLAKLKLKLRASIMGIIYHKCLHVRLAERSNFSEGEIQTYMSVDADRTVNLCNSVHDMWRSIMKELNGVKKRRYKPKIDIENDCKQKKKETQTPPKHMKKCRKHKPTEPFELEDMEDFKTPSELENMVEEIVSANDMATSELDSARKYSSRRTLEFELEKPLLQETNKQSIFSILTTNLGSDNEEFNICLEKEWQTVDCLVNFPQLCKKPRTKKLRTYFSVNFPKQCKKMRKKRARNLIKALAFYNGEKDVQRLRSMKKGSDHYEGYLFAVLLGLASILKSFLDTQYSYHLAKLKLKLRASIMGIIYHKCLHVRLAERSNFSEGEIQTYMSVDADRTVNLCNSVHDMWSLPLQIGIALYLLYTQVKFAFLAGLAITILLIPVNKWIAELIAKATKNMMEQKDERIRRTAELLTYIRTLKMYSWELLFSTWLTKTRSLEVKYLSTRKYLDAWCVFFWATTPTFFSLFTFGLYTLMGNQLDAATVFTCLALFNNLISPLNSFPWVINGLIDAFISAGRLSKYLSSSGYRNGAENRDNISMPSNMAVVVSDASSSWSANHEKEFNLVLDDITLRLPKGCLVSVIGEVGSGKSSLLNLLLGEMKVIDGSIYLSGSTTYVPQIPWILSGTIRDNIIFGRDFDSTRYLDVLKACALDLDVSMMVGGDMALIGEKGINLSGGQRARLALARSLYCSSDIFMLDDVLSAVDAHVASSILNNAILGPLMNHQTRVLCTHNVQAIYASDVVVEMDKGKVKWVGTPQELSISSYLATTSIDSCNITPGVQVEEKSFVVTEVEEEVQEDDSVSTLVGLEISFEAEARKEGRVEPTVYKKYAEFAGWFIAILTLFSAILMQFSRNGNDLWLSYWVDTTGRSQKSYSVTFYLEILGLFCLVNSTLTLVRAFAFAFGGIRAAIHVHDRLLNKLVNANVSFFDQTPTGRILNRFSSDLYTIDDALPFILNILLANIVGLLGIAIVLSYVQVVFLVLLLPFWYIYSRLQFYYRSTSRELRRLDSVSRSPIYASFTETLDGASTIRAFNSEDLFFGRFISFVRLYQRTSYSEVTASLWLSLRLQLLAALIVSFVAVMAVVGAQKHLPISLGTPGLVGLALSYAAPIVSLLGSFLTSFTETEKEMVSVERVLQYMDIPQEIAGDKQLNLENWPSQGEIQFQNVTLKYTASSPPALRGISFVISGGTQVGVIGRTGAGKSSVLNALFRLNPICSGSILIDGIDIARVSLRDLRSHLAVVPQTPFLFEGSLRSNLDPFQMNDDATIWNILEKCHMKQEVVANGGLDMPVKESGASFSVGQRQLLCLARALLKSSRVLCLDECTANIDTQTAAKLQDTIASECRGITVITIAHRISTVVNMDNILILDQGILAEQGNPRLLLQNETSLFSSFAKASKM